MVERHELFERYEICVKVKRSMENLWIKHMMTVRKQIPKLLVGINNETSKYDLLTLKYRDEP